MPKRTSSYRARLLEDLLNPSEAANYLNAALQDSPTMFLDALKDVAQAHQVAKVAKQAGVTRENIYRSLSRTGNPTWDTLHSVLTVLGLEFGIEARNTSTSGLSGVPKKIDARANRPTIRTSSSRSLKQLTRAQNQPFLPFVEEFLNAETAATPSNKMPVSYSFANIGTKVNFTWNQSGSDANRNEASSRQEIEEYLAVLSPVASNSMGHLLSNLIQ